MTINLKKVRTHNSGFALWGLTCFKETFVQGSTFVLRINSCAKNPPLRQAAKPLPAIFCDTPNIKTNDKNFNNFSSIFKLYFWSDNKKVEPTRKGF